MTLDQALARITELEAQVAWLESELSNRFDPAPVVSHALGLTMQQSRLVLLLYGGRGKVLSNDFLGTQLPAREMRRSHLGDRDDKSALKVLVWAIRRHLGRDFIDTQWGLGYRLAAKGLAAVKAALEERVAA